MSLADLPSLFDGVSPELGPQTRQAPPRPLAPGHLAPLRWAGAMQRAAQRAHLGPGGPPHVFVQISPELGRRPLGAPRVPLQPPEAPVGGRGQPARPLANLFSLFCGVSHELGPRSHGVPLMPSAPGCPASRRAPSGLQTAAPQIPGRLLLSL